MFESWQSSALNPKTDRHAVAAFAPEVLGPHCRHAQSLLVLKAWTILAALLLVVQLFVLAQLPSPAPALYFTELPRAALEVTREPR